MLGLLFVLLLQGSRLLSSGPADWYLWRGQCRQARLDWDGAQTQLLHAWHFDPQSYTVAEALGDLLVARGTWNSRQSPALWKKALGWYERAVSGNPYESAVLVKMARLFDAAGQRDKAVEHLQRAIQAAPQNAAYHAQLGLHYERWGDTKNALASFQRAADLDGSDRLVAQQLRLLATP